MSQPVWPQALCSDLHPLHPPEIGIMVTAIFQTKNDKPSLSDGHTAIEKEAQDSILSFSPVFFLFLEAPGGKQYSRMLRAQAVRFLAVREGSYRYGEGKTRMVLDEH